MATTMTMWSPMTHADYDLLLNKDVHSRDGLDAHAGRHRPLPLVVATDHP
jgi:hypothetical protein